MIASTKIVTFLVGQFSLLWIDQQRRLKFDVDVVESEWGEGANLSVLASKLSSDGAHTIKAICIVHNETATGVTNNLATVRKLRDEFSHPALLLVDGVSSICALDFCMEEWGVDVALTGSQKALSLPTVMGIVCASPKALEASKTATSIRQEKKNKSEGCLLCSQSNERSTSGLMMSKLPLRCRKVQEKKLCSKVIEPDRTFEGSLRTLLQQEKKNKSEGCLLCSQSNERSTSGLMMSKLPLRCRKVQEKKLCSRVIGLQNFDLQHKMVSARRLKPFIFLKEDLVAGAHSWADKAGKGEGKAHF
ncbi:Serine--glyoxylate aminotransferase [Platanthera zijinensis]|uniref:Serine--glyoxylate aminotransferase n=1 Tax=Platanthera zijinensis TaxID=2320716 RepID=A0AAP0BQC1_9ASPA